MSDRLCKQLPLLKLLHKAKPKQRRLILQSASNELILALCELALNILYGTIPLDPGQYRKLKRRKAEIKFVADKKIGISAKKKVFNQSGGFLLPLLSVAVPFISSLIASRQG